MDLVKFLSEPKDESIGVTESVSSVSVTLSLAMLAGVAKKLDKDVKILDLNLYEDWDRELDECTREYLPDLVGITFTTPQAKISNWVASRIRELLGSNVQIIGGGAHATAMPHEMLEQTVFDAVAIGEAETSFEEFLKRECFDGTTGWAYKNNNEVELTGLTPLIKNLDDLLHFQHDKTGMP